MNAKKNRTANAPAPAEYDDNAVTTYEMPDSPLIPQEGERRTAKNGDPVMFIEGNWCYAPLPETTAAPATEQEAELIDEADASDEAQADADAELDISDEDRQSITDAAAKVFEDGGEPAVKPAPIDGPVPLLGKTQGDAAATAHAAGTVAEAAKPAEQGAYAIRQWPFPEGFKPEEFGYTSAQVFNAAQAAHQANKAYCDSIGDMSQLDFNNAPDWQCQSAINGVCYAIGNGFPSPEAMHVNWMKEKVAAGWHWGVEKNPDAKTHPCIMPYANLPEDQRKKDDIFRDTIMRVLGPRAEAVKEAEPVEPGPPSQEAIAMGSMLECAAAMCGMLSEEGGFIAPEINSEVAMCLADYFRNEPGAPAAGGLMQVRLKLKVVLLPYEDPRRVELTLDLFRLALTRMEKFIAEDAKAEADRQLSERAQTLRKPADGEGTFDRDDDRLTKSDIGKALDQRAQ